METQKSVRKITVHPSACVASDVTLGDGVSIGANCVVESGSSIGSDTILMPNVFIGQNVVIGRNNRLFPNCAIGCIPQILGLKIDGERGGLVIGDNNVIREQVTIHPSMHASHATKIGNNNLIMIGVHIGHDCILEDNLVLSNFTQLSGHCLVHTGVWFSGLVLVHQFTTIGKWVYAAGLSGINHDIPPFVIVSGHYPPKIRGINRRGLARAGLSKEQQLKVFEAYKKLYRSDKPLLENAKALAAESGGLDENVKLMVDTIINSSKHRFGRYLELFRD